MGLDHVGTDRCNDARHSVYRSFRAVGIVRTFQLPEVGDRRQITSMYWAAPFGGVPAPSGRTRCFIRKDTYKCQFPCVARLRSCSRVFC